MRDSTTTDRPDDMLEGAATMLPSSFCAAMGRTVPSWFNLDAVVTSEDVAKIETARRDLVLAMPGLIDLAARARWAADLGGRMDALDDDLPEGSEIEGGFEVLNEILDLKEIQDLALLLGWLFCPHSSISSENIPGIVERCEGNVPGLPAACDAALEDAYAYTSKGADEMRAKWNAGRA